MCPCSLFSAILYCIIVRIVLSGYGSERGMMSRNEGGGRGCWFILLLFCLVLGINIYFRVTVVSTSGRYSVANTIDGAWDCITPPPPLFRREGFLINLGIRIFLFNPTIFFRDEVCWTFCLLCQCSSGWGRERPSPTHVEFRPQCRRK